MFGGKVKELVESARPIIKKDDREKVIEIMDDILEIVPEISFVLANKGWVLMNLEKNEAAEECFDRVIEFDSEYEYAIGKNQCYSLIKILNWHRTIPKIFIAIYYLYF